MTFYDWWGRETDLETFVTTYFHLNKLRWDEVGERSISTVFIGDVTLTGNGFLYETMIFPDNFRWKWRTMQQAFIGHQELWTSLRYPELAADEEEFQGRDL